MAVNGIQLWRFDDSKDYNQQIQAANYETTSVYGFGHPLYYKNVIDVLRGEAEPETDGCKGLKLLELLIAAYLSARNGQTVSLSAHQIDWMSEHGKRLELLLQGCDGTHCPTSKEYYIPVNREVRREV